MTNHETRFEQRLAAALDAVRPTEGAPAHLHARVSALPDARARWPRSPLRTFALGLSGLALLTAVAIAAYLGSVHGTAGVGAGGNAPAPTPALFDPRAEGPGLLYGVWPTLTIVPGAVSLVAIALAIRHVRRARWIGGWTGGARLMVLSAIALGALGLGVHPGFQWLGGVSGSVVGYDLQVRPPDGSLDDTWVWYEHVPPGDPLVVVVSLTNPGPLPIRLEGIVEDPNVREMVITRWVGMTVWQDQTVLPDLEKMPAFSPVTVEPNQQVYVYLAAKAGACSFGPDFRINSTDPDLSGYSNRGRVIHFAYSVFGLESSAPFELPMSLVEPMRNRCPPTP